MSQASSFNLNISHLAVAWLRQKINVDGKRTNAHLLALSSQLRHWNIERISANNANDLSQNLSIENVHTLKNMIHLAINKASIKQPDIIADQILFLAVGAIQIQSQNGSDQAWQLMNQFLQNLVKPEKDKHVFLLGFVMTALIVCAYTMTNINSRINALEHSSPTLASSALVGVADPITISMLALTYNKMKAGTCQLPQAAMLPTEQRRAFLMFVNKGEIDVHHVESLRLALGYVNCLYPQELMHPVPNTGNRL